MEETKVQELEKIVKELKEENNKLKDFTNYLFDELGTLKSVLANRYGIETRE